MEPYLGGARRARRLCGAPVRARWLGAHPGVHPLRVQGHLPGIPGLQRRALNGRPVRYKVSVHGPVFATATVGGRPYALARRRSTFGRDGLNLAALKDMTESEATTPHRFWQVANKFGFTFNWAYVSRKFTSFFVRAAPQAAARPRPAAADARRRQPRVDRLPRRAGDPHDTSAPRGCC